MITDQLLRVSSSQTVTASAVSTDTIDLSQSRDIGEGEDLFMHFAVTEAVTASGAATVTFQIIGSATADLGTPTVLGASRVIGKADLPIGARVAVRINALIASRGFRYIGANYVVATGPLTAGKFTADIVTDIQDGQKFYASGFSVV